MSYQYGHADQFFEGDQRVATADGENPPVRTVNTWALDVIYGATNRLSLDLTIPFSSNSGGIWSSGQFYPAKSSGLGDVGLQAEYWLNDPTIPSRVVGSVGLGFVAPTGRDGVIGINQNGVAKPIDEALQTGNGGWHLLLKAQGSARISGHFFGYASGWYGLSLTEHNQFMMNGVYRGVPDTYSGRLGAAYVVPGLEGLAVSAGGRINGVTVKDIVGGGDLYWRRPGYEVYVEPGLTWTLGPNMASISVPLRVYQNKLDSLHDIALGQHIGADFASHLISVSYARRF